MGFFFWIGRVCLWVLFFPLGIWRSLVHRSKKAEKAAAARHEELVRSLHKSEGPPV